MSLLMHQDISLPSRFICLFVFIFILLLLLWWWWWFCCCCGGGGFVVVVVVVVFVVVVFMLIRTSDDSAASVLPCKSIVLPSGYRRAEFYVNRLLPQVHQN